MRDIQVTSVEIGRINPAEYNPRAISDDAFGGLCTSLRKFGMPEPLVVNTRGMVLVGGHQRLRAAQALGWTHVPVVLVDLSPAEEKALNITLNNPKITGFFTDGLQDLLAELQTDFKADFEDLKLDELLIEDTWDDGKDEVDGVDENMAGIKATIKVKCPQELKDEVLVILKRAFLETSLEGVEIV